MEPAGAAIAMNDGRVVEKISVRALCSGPFLTMTEGVFQIIFNELSAAEISQLDTVLQLELLTEFKVSPDDLKKVDGERFGKLEREGKALYRYRARGYRIYFEVVDNGVRVHRVLHKNSLEDFLFRNKSKIAGHEDEVLAKSKSFWKLIEEGQRAKKV